MSWSCSGQRWQSPSDASDSCAGLEDFIEDDMPAPAPRQEEPVYDEEEDEVCVPPLFLGCMSAGLAGITLPWGTASTQSH